MSRSLGGLWRRWKTARSTLTSPDGASPLHMAAAAGTAKECPLFIETLKCDINGTDDEGKTALFKVPLRKNGETTVTTLFLNCETPLNFAANLGVDLHANYYRGTPLHYAAASGNCESIECLLEHKAEPNPTNSPVDTSIFFQATVALASTEGVIPFLFDNLNICGLPI